MVPHCDVELAERTEARLPFIGLPTMKKLIARSLCLAFSSILSAAELPLVTVPDLKSPLPAEWSVRHGTWQVNEGEMKVAELPQNKHAAVLWHQVPLQKGAVECEFRFDGAKVFILGCDGDRHIGRVVIQPKALRLLDDSSEIKGKVPSTLLAEAKIDLKPGQWYSLRYTWDGEHMTAKLGDTFIEASHAHLAKKKTRWWLAVGGASVQLRHIKVYGLP